MSTTGERPTGLDAAGSVEVMPDCPQWCDLGAGHQYDSIDGTTEIRIHVRSFRGDVVLEQIERADAITGLVTRYRPHGVVQIGDAELTVRDLKTVATDAAAAARFLAEVEDPACGMVLGDAFCVGHGEELTVGPVHRLSTGAFAAEVLYPRVGVVVERRGCRRRRPMWKDLNPKDHSGDVDLDDDSLTTADAAALAGVSPLLISKWRSRGHLTPARLDQQGRPLYMARDVLTTEARLRRSSRSRR